MDLEKLASEVIESDDFKNLVKEKLADKVVGSYHCNSYPDGFLIKDSIQKLVRIEAEKIIKELTENYEELTLKKDIDKTVVDLLKRVKNYEERLKNLEAGNEPTTRKQELAKNYL